MRRIPSDRALLNCTFFITINVLNRAPRFASDVPANLVLEALQFYRRRGDIDLYGWVIMPDHLHLLLRVNGLDTATTWVRRFKSFTTHAFGERPFWQHGFWSEIVVTSRFFLQKLTYIHGNPTRAGLCENAEQFQWSSALEYSIGTFETITPHWEIDKPLSSNSSTEAAV